MTGQRRRLTPLGKEIKKKLIDKGMTQVQLADRLGIGKQYLTKIMNGSRSGAKYVDDICSILNINKKHFEDAA